MTKALALRDVLNVDNFDPMDIDVSEFQNLSDLMPKDGNIDLKNAEILASIYLRAADRCSEILSALICKSQRAKTNKNEIRQKLYLFAKDEGHKTIDDRRAYSESHPEYIDASDEVTKVETVRRWFEDKHKWFLESHRYMKAKWKSEQNHMKSSGFSETSGVDEYGNFGEKQW